MYWLARRGTKRRTKAMMPALAEGSDDQPQQGQHGQRAQERRHLLAPERAQALAVLDVHAHAGHGEVRRLENSCSRSPSRQQPDGDRLQRHTQGRHDAVEREQSEERRNNEIGGIVGSDGPAFLTPKSPQADQNRNKHRREASRVHHCEKNRQIAGGQGDAVRHFDRHLLRDHGEDRQNQRISYDSGREGGWPREED